MHLVIMASAENSCFGSLKIEQIKEKEAELVNVNSLKNEKKSFDAFNSYSEEICVENTDFFMYTEQ